MKKCQQAYRDTHKQLRKQYSHIWYLSNHKRVRATVRKYQTALIQRYPGWLTPEQEQKIIDIYCDRPKGMTVDHIIPLQGEFVSGLHHPDNLQYLTNSENCTKGNKYSVGR